ncbi:STAS domain-containing protein [Rufibacter psychrotolerans]|uniref:STAS domain-containing protein n=1 Tax=Rufibacter psychrotolerans TaxID=2812556 RepID=UPI001967BA57|nr:STAS domain-containing protein [Rufibacter sp. SYSU D00308]
MKIDHVIENNVLIIRLEGDMIGGPETQRLMDLANSTIDESLLLSAVDLSNVRFINSTGIGVLVSLLTKFRNRGGELILINPSEHIRKLLIITKLNAIFTIAENDTNAVQLLKESL